MKIYYKIHFIDCRDYKKMLKKRLFALKSAQRGSNTFLLNHLPISIYLLP